MERKEIIVPAKDRWGKDTSFWVVKRWCVVHARTGTLAQQNVRPCDTREEAQRDCDCIVKNNPADVLRAAARGAGGARQPEDRTQRAVYLRERAEVQEVPRGIRCGDTR